MEDPLKPTAGMNISLKMHCYLHWFQEKNSKITPVVKVRRTWTDNWRKVLFLTDLWCFRKS